MLRRLAIHIWLLLGLFVLHGCAGMEFRELDIGAPRVAEPAPQVSSQALLARYGGRYENPALQGRMENIVSRLSRASETQSQTYSVTILNTPQINAFALDSGQLFVTRGLLAFTSSEDDIASVLAHEMAHVILRHGPQRREALDRILRNASLFNASGQGGEMSRDSFFRSAQFTLAEYTQVQELEADRLGQTLMDRAGFDPTRAAAMLVHMGREDARRARVRSRSAVAGRGDSFLSTHPSNSERITRARAFPVSASAMRGEMSQLPDPSYINVLNGMIFGDTAENGFLRDGRFLHPVLRIGFDLPEGYLGENTPEAVFAAGPEGQLIRFDADRLQRELNIRDYLTLDWLKDIRADDVARLEVAGREAAWTRVSTPQAQFYFGAIKWSRTTVYRFMLIAPINDLSANAAFTTMLQSMRTLPQAEADDLRPLRLSVREVPATGAETLVRALPSGITDPSEFLAILNGVDRLEELTPGSQIKTVTR